LPDYCCRGCSSTDATLLLDMGIVPMANDFVSADHPAADAERFPLNLVMCNACHLVQIKEIVPPERMFRNYLWVSGTSATLQQYAADFAARLAKKCPPQPGSFLVEIASNDGTLLSACRQHGFEVLGVDPSSVAKEANQNGIPTLNEFFGLEVATSIVRQRGQASAIVARNVIGHVAQPVDLVRGIKKLLGPHGRCIIESPYAGLLREEIQYDTVFHEHVCYFTIGSLSKLLEREGLRIVDLTFSPMNGGSFVAEVTHADVSGPSGAQPVLDLEKITQLNEPRGWDVFSHRAQAQRRELRSLLKEVKQQGAKVVAYGAAAKFMTMLNYCDIGTDLLVCVGDANPRKQGMLCPGVRIPVVSPQSLMDEDPDYILIGAWNFRDEIVRQFRDKHGFAKGFLLPLPVPRKL
jgi:SAM-dependent methyltransferase